MKALLNSFLKNKNILAFAFALVLIITTGFIFNDKPNTASADTAIGGGTPTGGGAESDSVDVVGGGGQPTNPSDGGGSGGSVEGVGGDVIGGEAFTIPVGTPLCGFAWSSNVGWLSFNKEDCDLNNNGVFDDGVPGCPTSGNVINYGVSVDSQNRLNGFAWSSNIGWVKFGCAGGSCLSGNPSTDGNGQSRATILGASGQVAGWARACAGSAAGDCSVASRNDGWDGWISLRGTGVSNYGVTFNNKTTLFSGDSWGGPVVGWLRWAKGSTDSGVSYAVRHCTAPTLTATLTASPDSGSVAELANVTLTATPTPGTGISYRFKCDSSAPWSNPQAGNTYSCNNVYTSDGTYYYPHVQVTQGTLVATAPDEVYTDPVFESTVSVSCDAEPEVAQINQPITWTATIIDPPVADSYNYTYEFRFENNGVPEPVEEFSGSFETSHQVVKSYSTLGNKSLVVEVTDNNGIQGPITGECSIDASVIVNPTIIEI